jgi:hypothetical protein
VETASREDLLTLIGVLQDQNTALCQQVAQQQTEIAQLRAGNEWLTVRVAELERRLGRNSGNSSPCPSSDTFTRPEKKPGNRPHGVARGSGRDFRSPSPYPAEVKPVAQLVHVLKEHSEDFGNRRRSIEPLIGIDGFRPGTARGSGCLIASRLGYARSEPSVAQYAPGEGFPGRP